MAGRKKTKAGSGPEDGARLFEAAMRDATPLDEETRQKFAREEREPDIVVKPKRKTSHKPPAALKSTQKTRSAIPAPQESFDRATLRQLRQGKLAVEGRLDLHGLTQTEAHAKLIRFVQASARAGKRCVLVITGKGVDGGERSDDSGRRGHADPPRGVLRRMTPMWLAGPEIAHLIVDHQTALPRDGGDGAMYVRLRRS